MLKPGRPNVLDLLPYSFVARYTFLADFIIPHFTGDSFRPACFSLQGSISNALLSSPLILNRINTMTLNADAKRNMAVYICWKLHSTF
jgi:hypothetical protein